MIDSTATAFPALHDAQFMVMTTYRKTGEGVPTTLWFAQAGDKLYFTTGPTSGKVKRLRNNPRVVVAPSDRVGTVLGASAEAVARFITPEEIPAADALLEAKYGAARKQVFQSMQLSPTASCFIEIAPAHPAE